MSLVALETLAPGLARLRLRRPDKRNALNQELLRDAIAAIGAAEEAGAAVGILAAEGQAFCAGADLREASSATDSLTMVDLCDRLLDCGGPRSGAGSRSGPRRRVPHDPGSQRGVGEPARDLARHVPRRRRRLS